MELLIVLVVLVGFVIGWEIARRMDEKKNG